MRNHACSLGSILQVMANNGAVTESEGVPAVHTDTSWMQSV
jgi:hypothetical protein